MCLGSLSSGKRRIPLLHTLFLFSPHAARRAATCIGGAMRVRVRLPGCCCQAGRSLAGVGEGCLCVAATDRQNPALAPSGRSTPSSGSWPDLWAILVGCWHGVPCWCWRLGRKPSRGTSSREGSTCPSRRVAGWIRTRARLRRHRCRRRPTPSGGWYGCDHGSRPRTSPDGSRGEPGWPS